MTKLLIFIQRAEHRGPRYLETLQPAFPEIDMLFTDDPAVAMRELPEADALLTYGPQLNDEMVKAAGKLKWLHSLITGLDFLLKVPSLSHDIVVTSTRGIHGAPVSEMALLLMMALARGLPLHLRNQAKHVWARQPGDLIDKKTVGILGVGAIAGELAPRLQALGMTVVGISGAPDRAMPGFDRMAHRDDLVRVAAELDHLVLLIPYSPESHHIIDADVLKAMKPTAYLTNVARGGVVDDDALVAALKAGEIAGAGLDAFATEPLPADSPLWDLENVIITPHNAGLSEVYVDDAMPVVEQNLKLFIAGKSDEMVNIVDRSINLSI